MRKRWEKQFLVCLYKLFQQRAFEDREKVIHFAVTGSLYDLIIHCLYCFLINSSGIVAFYWIYSTTAWKQYKFTWRWWRPEVGWTCEHINLRWRKVFPVLYKLLVLVCHSYFKHLHNIAQIKCITRKPWHLRLKKTFFEWKWDQLFKRKDRQIWTVSFSLFRVATTINTWQISVIIPSCILQGDIKSR